MTGGTTTNPSAGGGRSSVGSTPGPTAANPLRTREYVVSWSVGGTDVTTSYDEWTLFGPAREDESITFFEWLTRGLWRDGFDHLTIRPVRDA